MNDLQRLEKIQQFFIGIRRRWVWMLLALGVAFGGITLTGEMENTEGFWFSVVRYVVLIAILFVVLWVSSFFVINKIKKKRTEIYKKGLTVTDKPEEKAQFSFSRLLSIFARWKAYIRFKELREASDYCFLGGPMSYLRVQLLNPELRQAHEPMDMVYSWPEKDRIAISFAFEDEETLLTVQRRISDEGERVYACLTPVNPTRSDYENAEGVQLILDEPCLLTYDFIYKRPNGTRVERNEMLCVITWMGGNR